MRLMVIKKALTFFGVDRESPSTLAFSVGGKASTVSGAYLSVVSSCWSGSFLLTSYSIVFLLINFKPCVQPSKCASGS